MELEGQIEDIIYQNEVNSYTIATFVLEKSTITVVGYLPFINVGDSLKIYGKYVTHQEYGEQFKIDTFEKIMPKTLAGLERYLAGGVIKGVGPATAKRIINTFGEETIAVFKFEPGRLADVKGISKEKALEIAEEFNEKWELWQIVGFLEKFGISASNCKKVYEKLGKNAVEEIEKNPYILLDITYGVDFKQIDKMAMDLGIEYNNNKRIESAIKYSLVLSSYNGHTCVIKENLIKFVVDILDVQIEDIEEALINLNAKEEIVLEKRDEEVWAYLYPFYKAEKNITEKLVALDKSNNIKKVKNIKEEILKQEQKLDIILSEKQKEAVTSVNEDNVCIITGGPGTGKTTIIKCIIEIYKQKKLKVVLCAPTGRAAKRMTETTGENACTIHRLLEIGKLDEEGKIADADYDIAPIDADVIIIDEMSMVDTFLMNYILKGIYLGTKLVLVGDSNQLPSVGPGNVLKDIIESEKVTVVELNKIFRQAARSKIIVNAHNVNNGINFLNNNQNNDINQEDIQLEDFFYINETSQIKAVEELVSLCNGRLKKFGNYDFFKDIQVLSPTKKGMLGTKELNILLQKELNPQTEMKMQKNYGDIIFRENDRVMQIKNNYDIYWEKKVEGKYETGNGVFNGELGSIKKIDEESRQIEIIFDDEKVAWYRLFRIRTIRTCICDNNT